jgi:tetratricopeptide (TPR) repeat protein
MEDPRIKQLNQRAIAAIGMKQYEYAVSLFQTILSIDSNFLPAIDGLKAARVKLLENKGLKKRALAAAFYLLKAAFFEMRNKWDKALEIYQTIDILMPGNLQIVAKLGDIYIRVGMRRKARDNFEQILKMENDNIYALRRLGTIFLEEKDVKTAKDIYDRLAALNPTDPETVREIKDSYSLITIDLSQNKDVLKEKRLDSREFKEDISDGSKKIKALKSRISANPNNLKLREEFINLLIEDGYLDEAITEYKNMAALTDNPEEIRLRMADLLIEKGFLTEAITNLEESISLFPDGPLFYKKLGEIYIRREDTNNAVEIFKKLTTLQPNDVDFRMMLADLHVKGRYFEEAIAELEKVITIDSQNAEAYRVLTNLLIRRGYKDRAKNSLIKLNELKPQDIEAKRNLADIYLGDGNITEAMAKFKEILELNAEDSQAKDKYREIQQRLMREELKGLEAKSNKLEEDKKRIEDIKTQLVDHETLLYQKRIKDNPEDYASRLKLGEIYLSKGLLDKSISELQQVIKKDTANVSALLMLGHCFREKKLLDLAIKQFVRAVEISDVMSEEKKEALYNLAEVYEEMGDKEKAVSYLKQIYEVDISYKDVAKKIEEGYK